MRHIAAFGLATVLVAAVAYGKQTPTPAMPVAQTMIKSVSGALIVTKDGQPTQVSPNGQPVPPNPDAAAKAAAEKPKDSPRLKKLQQQQYDRKPSTILKLWAESPSQSSENSTFVGPPAPPESDPIDAELACLRRMVTLGEWDRVKTVFANYSADDGKAGYKHMVKSLMTEAPQQGGPQIPPQYKERNRFSMDDLIGIAGASPTGLDRENLGGLAMILRNVIQSGVVPETAIAKLRDEVSWPEGGALTSRQVGLLLLVCDLEAEAGEFLPDVESALEYKDLEGLNLLARHYLALFAKEKKTAALEKAWNATQAILALEGDKENKEEALKRAVEIAPKVKEELGQAWLSGSFTKSPERGQEILATLGGLAASGIQSNPRNQDARLKSLQLQKTAVDALVKAAPERANDWREVLSVLASNWLKEAEFSYQYARSISAGPSMRRDRWGNMYYMQDFDNEGPYFNRQPNIPSPIEAMDVLTNRPDGEWLARVDDTYKPKLAMVVAQLHLKVNEDIKAFPHIEELAKTHPQKAKDLVNEFLRVWTRNHDPNTNRGYTNPYMFIYGFDMRSNSIPLTRSKQERNLLELAGLVEKLRKMPIGDPDEELLAKAFTTCHSSAEVYKLDTIERVFGSLEKLKPKTLGGLADQMRSNLASLWRQPKEQNDKKTNRKQKDIQTEVLRGYGVAKTVIDRGIEKYPNEWLLVSVKAGLIHDEANFLHEIEKTSEYAPRIVESMNTFARSAKMYTDTMASLAEDEETSRAFETWFYAALGAVDLQQLSDEKLPDGKQFPIIKAALNALPGEAGDRHRTKFANQLFNRMSSVAPACKVRYLKAGFEIVGDHKAAYEAKKVYDYYKDLVAELKLEAVPDGPAEVGHGKPFGVFVNLRHTREIERESGGFSKYLQNQTSGRFFYYNYGRPPADYRDKFQAIVQEAFKENFEVLSVTFQTEKVTSKAAKDYGWRFTPYAYLLLKARGPQVDKLPPVRLDLDFLDTSGYVILPIESPAVPVDASATSPPSRPLRNVKVTQVLDERKAADGKLALEIKASGLGLIGDIDSLVDKNIAGFKFEKIEDPGVSVVKFDDEGDGTVVVSERNFLVHYTAASTGEDAPKTVRFPKLLIPTEEIVYQRFNDADLVPAKEEVVLGETYARPKSMWWWLAVPAGAGLMLMAGIAAWLLLRPKAVLDDGRLAIPENLTPFALLDLLGKVERNNGFAPDRKSQLRQTIEDVEHRYFATDANNAAAPDLRRIAEEWVMRQ
jgi:hypothetical protein